MECGYSFKSQCVNTTRRDLYLRALSRSQQGWGCAGGARASSSPASRLPHGAGTCTWLMSRCCLSWGCVPRAPGCCRARSGARCAQEQQQDCRVQGWPGLGTSGCRQHRERWELLILLHAGQGEEGPRGAFCCTTGRTQPHPQRQSPRSLSILPQKAHLCHLQLRRYRPRETPGQPQLSHVCSTLWGPVK